MGSREGSRIMRGKEGGGRAAASSRVLAETDIFFRSIGSQSASIHPPPPISLRFSRDRTAELALIFTSCDCKNGEPFGERYMLKICRVAIWLNGNGDASSRLQLSFYK